MDGMRCWHDDERMVTIYEHRGERLEIADIDRIAIRPQGANLYDVVATEMQRLVEDWLMQMEKAACKREQ